ncbi:MAG TPA: hypothetical protein VHY34_08690 [Caulobacteraceae bacterium]|nr:hypothetical protein [Caulobacteraceae bacterium]
MAELRIGQTLHYTIANAADKLTLRIRHSRAGIGEERQLAQIEAPKKGGTAA